MTQATAHMPSSIRTIFVFQPFTAEFDAAYHLIRLAAEGIGAKLLRLDEVAVAGSMTELIYQSIETSDLIICDVTGANSNVMYELGYAHALRRPVILISQGSEHLPFDVKSVRTLHYDLDVDHASEFVRALRALIGEAFANPSLFSNRPRTEKSASTVFISYSHKDANFLQRLRVHLKPLEKQGLIDLWDDSRLEAGDQWKVAIEEALQRARAAILLVTADFLASEFIVDDELPPLLSRAESQGTRIIPIIIKPCRFTRDGRLGTFQAINDPSRSLITLSEGEQEKLYDEVSALVERSMER